MLDKLKTRYSASQKEYLSYCTYLDPRFKNCVNFDLPSFKTQIKEINDSYIEVILDTQSQTLGSIEPNPSFATPIHRQAVATSSNSKRGSFFKDDYSQEEDIVRTSGDVMTKISQELDHYARIKLLAVEKENLNLLN